VVATREPYRAAALLAVRALSLEWRLELNKGAVMLLPAGVDKRTGLAAALAGWGLSLRDAVAVGDAENDQAMLSASGRGVAVANATPALRAAASLVTHAAQGEGVEELVARLLEEDPGPGPLLVK